MMGFDRKIYSDYCHSYSTFYIKKTKKKLGTKRFHNFHPLITREITNMKVENIKNTCCDLIVPAY